MRQLPPLSALRVFEVAARTGSYVDAGRALGLTHGAVSRQISALEVWFGQRLFVRVGRRMVATQAARAFAAEVSRAFDRITAAADATGKPAAARLLRVSAPTTFAMRWLIPRLPAFEAARPEAEVSVTTVTTLQDELRGGFDVAIRRGLGGPGPQFWPQHEAIHFLPERDVLIASPSLLQHHPVARPEDLCGAAMLASETRPRDWADWLNAAGLSHPPGRWRVFDHFFVTLQAVTDGLGFGIGPLPVLERELQLRRLVAPLPGISVERPGYHALVPFDADKSASLAALLDWLVAEGRPAGQ